MKCEFCGKTFGAMRNSLRLQMKVAVCENQDCDKFLQLQIVEIPELKECKK